MPVTPLKSKYYLSHYFLFIHAFGTKCSAFVILYELSLFSFQLLWIVKDDCTHVMRSTVFTRCGCRASITAIFGNIYLAFIVSNDCLKSYLRWHSIACYKVSALKQQPILLIYFTPTYFQPSKEHKNDQTLLIPHVASQMSQLALFDGCSSGLMVMRLSRIANDK